MPDPAAAPTLECRPTSGLAGCAWFLLLMAVVPAGAACFLPRDLTALLLLFGGMFLFLALLTAAIRRWIAGGTVNAGPRGLQQRTVVLSWEEITDYYTEAAPRRPETLAFFTVEGPGGAIRVSSAWSNVELLRRWVRERAVHARTREWGRLGYRELDERPREFTYPDERFSTGVYWINILFAGGAFLWSMWVVVTRGGGILHELGWPLGLLALAATLVTANLLGLMLLAFRPLAKARERRQGQRIVADAEGLRLRDHERETRINWSEITEYGWESASGWLKTHRYVVRGRRAELDYTPSLERIRLLNRLLELYAPPQARRRDDSTERLGGAGAAWTSGVEGVGDRVFTYRTRSNRALLILLGFIALIAAAAPLLRPGPPPAPDAWIPSGILSLLWTWAFWRYQCGGIRVDELGLTERSFRGDVTLRWDEVETYRKCGGDLLISARVEGAGRRLGFSLYIAGADELMQEIAIRSHYARQRGWSAGKCATDLLRTPQNPPTDA